MLSRVSTELLQWRSTTEVLQRMQAYFVGYLVVVFARRLGCIKQGS